MINKGIPIKVDRIEFFDTSDMVDVECILTDSFLIIADSEGNAPNMYNLACVRALHGVDEKMVSRKGRISIV